METLLRYNVEDVVHLPTLLALVYNTRVQQTPFALDLIVPPPLLDIPFGFDEAVIQRTLTDTGRAIMLAESRHSFGRSIFH